MVAFEILALVSAIFISLCMSVLDQRKTKSMLFLFFIAFLAFCSFNRISYPTVDFLSYTDYLINGIDLFNPLNSFYFLREPFFWGIIQIGHKLGFSTQIYFLIIDVLIIILVSLALKRLEVPNYFIAIFFIAFFSLIGIQNIYRQWIATSFLIIFYSFLVNRRGLKSNINLLLSINSHNSTFFAGLLSIFRSRKLNFYLYFIGLPLLVLVFYYGGDTKSIMSSNLDLTIIFVGINAIVVSIIILSGSHEFLEKYYFYNIAIIWFLISILSIVFLTGDSSERYQYIFMSIFFPILSINIERTIYPVELARILLLFILTIPILHPSILHVVLNIDL